jgi:hypothetical protein
MDRRIISTLPASPAKRQVIFAMRLTEAERGQIEALAARLRLPDSVVARHFILEAVRHHAAESSEAAHIDG